MKHALMAMSFVGLFLAASVTAGEQDDAQQQNVIRICQCLEQGKDANCQPLTNGSSGDPRPAAAGQGQHQ